MIKNTYTFLHLSNSSFYNSFTIKYIPTSISYMN